MSKFFEFGEIRPGDRVTIRVGGGGQRTGKAVLFNRMHNSWTLNLGGKHGTPAVAVEGNFICGVKARQQPNGFTVINGRGC